jgi:D-glycero-D-manno-heptose 1,7-bisphosphate phosphatase
LIRVVSISYFPDKKSVGRFSIRWANFIAVKERILMISRDPQPPLFFFLDRDGTLIEEKNYLSSVDQIAFIAGAEQAIARLNGAGFKVVVVSNQSGVGRGFFPESTVHDIHRAIQEHLAKHQARIDAFYYCPHLPDAGCPCRKPKTALFERAAQDMELPLRGFMVGDKTSDLFAARAAGLAAILVRTGYGEKTVAEEENLDADFIAADLAEAVEWILSPNADEPQPNYRLTKAKGHKTKDFIL